MCKNTPKKLAYTPKYYKDLRIKNLRKIFGDFLQHLVKFDVDFFYLYMN